MLSRHRREGAVQLLGAPRLQDLKPHPQRPGGGFDRLELQLIHSRVSEYRHPGEVRLHLLEKLDMLAAHLRNVQEDTREVVAGAGQSGPPSES
jgi:hypothetical protein